MKSTHLFLIILVMFYFSCETGTNPKYLQDVTINSKGLECDGIKIADRSHKKNSEFIYGEKPIFLYDNIKGFALKDGLAYPDMDIYVMTKKGDTVMAETNLFKHKTEGFTEAELNLRTELTFATPMFPNNEYLVKINIRDKNSDAHYNWSKNFTVINNPLLKVKKNGLSYKVQYLFSRVRNIAITDNVIKFNENIFLLIENLDGFDIDDHGNADLQASISLTSADGTLINKKDNLFPNLVNAKDLKEQLYASLKITGKNIKSPVTCIFKVKDAESGHSLETTFDLTVVE